MRCKGPSVTKTQSAGPLSCLEHCTTRVLHCTMVTRAAVLTFPLLLQTIITNQMRLRKPRAAKNRVSVSHGSQSQHGSVNEPETAKIIWPDRTGPPQRWCNALIHHRTILSEYHLYYFSAVGPRIQISCSRHFSLHLSFGIWFISI